MTDPIAGWWWYDMGPPGRAIPHVVLVEDYDGALYADVGNGQKPVRPGPWWLAQVASMGEVAALTVERDAALARVAELEAPGECNSIHKLRAQVAGLQAAIERVRPVVDELAAAWDCGSPVMTRHLMERLGRAAYTTRAQDVTWLRSLLPTAPDPVHRPGHTDLMVAPESVPREAPTWRRIPVEPDLAPQPPPPDDPGKTVWYFVREGRAGGSVTAPDRLADRPWWRWCRGLTMECGCLVLDVSESGHPVLEREAGRRGHTCTPDPADPLLPGWLLHLLRGLRGVPVCTRPDPDGPGWLVVEHQQGEGWSTIEVAIGKGAREADALVAALELTLPGGDR